MILTGWTAGREPRDLLWMELVPSLLARTVLSLIAQEFLLSYGRCSYMYLLRRLTISLLYLRRAIVDRRTDGILTILRAASNTCYILDEDEVKCPWNHESG